MNTAADVLAGRAAWAVDVGDSRPWLEALPGGSCRTCVTSPPYWGGLRDYGDARQVGLERDPAAYAACLLEVFAGVRRVLDDDGCLWLNVGEVYAASGKGGGGSAGKRSSWDTVRDRKGFRMPPRGYKMKDQTLVPFLVADALRKGGWYLRSTVVWSKMAAAEPQRADRPSLSHEYLFLLAKSERYAASDPGEPWWGTSVWHLPSDVCREHPATMPGELVRRCLVCLEDGPVIDPFAGSGTTGVVCRQLGRRFLGCDLNPAYADIARRRIADANPLGDFAASAPARQPSLFGGEAAP